MPILILILVLGLVAWLCLRGANAVEQRWRLRSQEIVALYRPTVLFCREQFLGFHFSERKMIVGNATEAYEYGIESLTKCELIQDDVAIHTADRGSQVVGVLVGAAALGPIGALLGGLTASKQTRKNVKKIALRLTVDDPEKPIHDVVFFAAMGSGQRAGILTKKDADLAYTFHAYCLNAIRSSDLRNVRSNTPDY